MKDATTRFAVIICTHNGLPYLDAQLASLASQKLQPSIVIVHDWGSTDDTVAAVRRFAQTQSARYPVQVYQHGAAPGPAKSFIHAVGACIDGVALDFDYLLFCDQDDIWSPDKLAVYDETLRRSASRIDILFSDVRLVAADGTQVADSYYAGVSAFRPPSSLSDASILLANPVIGMTLGVSRTCLAAIRPQLSGPWLMHDWAIVLLALSRGFRATYVDIPLVDYRQHSANTLGASTGLRIRARLGKIRPHFRGLRDQVQLLVSTSGSGWSPDFDRVLRGGVLQRFRLASAAFKSKILRKPSAVLLGFAVILFW